MALDTQEREKKRELAELKEKISHFLYRHFIDFERDRTVMMQGKEVTPNFVLMKFGVVIDCYKSAAPGNAEMEDKIKIYNSDGVKYLVLDLGNLQRKEVDFFLEEKLPQLGVEL